MQLCTHPVLYFVEMIKMFAILFQIRVTTRTITTNLLPTTPRRGQEEQWQKLGRSPLCLQGMIKHI
jgi:hypothetical protein